MVLKSGHFGKQIRNIWKVLRCGAGEEWRRSVGPIVWALHRVKEERNILHTIKRRKANWIGHILRRNCLLKHAIEGNLEERIEMTGRGGRRRKQLLDNLKETIRYWKLKEEALDRTLWRTRFGRGYGPVVRQTTEWMTCAVSGYRMSNIRVIRE
jgi:hypothetical protein